MNSQINLSNKKKIFNINSIIKANKEKKNFSSRSNTQEMPHYNRSKNKSSSFKNKKTKNANNSLYCSKNEEFTRKFTGMTNISTKINSDTNSISNTAKNEYKNLNIYQFKEIKDQKEKKIIELEKQIKIYKDKLKNQIRVFNINTSINSFNLSKTRSSTNITERNIYQIRSFSNNQAKIKTSFPKTKKICGNKIIDNKINSNKNKKKSKKRAKSNNYKKPKINNYFFENKIIDYKMHINNFKRNENNNKHINKKYQDNIMEYKRAKSSTNAEKKWKNNNMTKSTAKYNNKNEILLTIEETQKLCEQLMEKMKNVLELVKIATTED